MKAIFAVAFAAFFVAFVSTGEAVKCPPTNGVYVTLVANPYDCSTYYICNEGIPYLMYCNPGLLFNDEEKVCDWPDHAKCKQPGTGAPTDLPTTVELTTVPPPVEEASPPPVEEASPPSWWWDNFDKK